MSEINSADLTISGLFATTSLAFLIYHTWRLDGCRCLLPRKSEWFKCLMTWMLLLSNLTLVVWAWGWAHVKYTLGWIQLGAYAARPWPSEDFPPQFQHYNTPLTVMICLSYSLHASLNAEEALYWAYTMKVACQPHPASPFLRSYYFVAWIVITAIIFVVQLAVPFIGHEDNSPRQLAVGLLVAGLLELLVVISAMVVVLKFPKFLRDVQKLGAGQDIRIRLYVFHELNKNRTFFRFTFCVPLIIIGMDVISGAATVSRKPIVGDLLGIIIAGSLAIVYMISVMLYLPRSASSSGRNMVKVGELPSFSARANSFALQSVMVEGGQLRVGDGNLSVEIEEIGAEDSATRVSAAPFANAEASGSNWRLDCEGGRRAIAGRSKDLMSSFESPIAVDIQSQPHRPVEIRIQVQRTIHET